VTEQSIDELAALIRRGLAADEEAATEAGGTRFELADYLWDTKYLIAKGAPGTPPRYTTEFNADLANHIVRHSPARVLRDVARDRALLDEALAWEHHEGCGMITATSRVLGCDCGRDARVRAVLQHLATSYQEGL
jgi:hypothetical protein